MAASLAEHRAQLGDEVTVVTGTGDYVIYAGSPETPAPANLKIRRLFTPNLGKSRKLARVLDYAAFFMLACLRMLFLPRQDVIVTLTTPPFIALAAILHRWVHPGVRVVLWNMDCYPEIAEQAGVVRPGGWLSRLLRALNRQLFRRFDAVVCLDQAMHQLLRDSYAPPQTSPTFHIIPNWEPAEQFAPDRAIPAWENAPVVTTGEPFVVLYLGNAGFGHSFETIVEVAIQLRDEPFIFLFVGGGQKWGWLAEAAQVNDLANIKLYAYVPKETTSAVMAHADCALITLNESALGLISPSKLHANLAMRLPVLYVGPRGSNVDAAIQKYTCGVSVLPGELPPLIAFLRRLRDDSAYHEGLRSAARRAFDSEFNDGRTLPLFDQLLDDLAPPSPGKR